MRIDFRQKVMKRFGGRFRVAKAGVNPTKAQLQFFRGGMPVGVAVVGPGHPAAWKWYGYDLSKGGGYDEVHMASRGGTLPGYLGMDNLVRRSRSLSSILCGQKMATDFVPAQLLPQSDVLLAALQPLPAVLQCFSPCPPCLKNVLDTTSDPA